MEYFPDYSYISSGSFESNGDAGKVEISHVGSILMKDVSYISSDSVGVLVMPKMSLFLA